MENDGRTVPPSAARTAAANNRGIYPRTPLLSSGVVLLTVACVLKVFGPSTAEKLTSLVRDGIASATRTDAAHAADTASALGLRGVASAAPIFVAILLAALSATWIPALIARSKKGFTNTPLPRNVPNTTRRRIIRLLGMIAAVGAGIIIAKDGFTDTLLTVGPDATYFSSASGSVPAIMAAAGGILLTTGVFDLIMQKGEIANSLNLTRSQATCDQRSESSDPKVRTQILKTGRSSR